MAHAVCMWYSADRRELWGRKWKTYAVKEALQRKDLRINRDKIEYLEYDFGKRECRQNRERQKIKLSGLVVRKIKKFKYLGSVVPKNSRFEEDMKYMTKCRWIKWRYAPGIGHKIIPIRLIVIVLFAL